MIFNLFKSKPSLKELIPDRFVDIHSHILPEIDDGAKNVKESLVLISEMKQMGFSKIIGTPHTYPGLYDNTNYSIENSFNKISKKIDSDVEVSFASEYMLDKQLIEKAMTLVDEYYEESGKDKLPTSKNINYMRFQEAYNKDDKFQKRLEKEIEMMIVNGGMVVP